MNFEELKTMAKLLKPNMKLLKSETQIQNENLSQEEIDEIINEYTKAELYNKILTEIIKYKPLPF